MTTAREQAREAAWAYRSLMDKASDIWEPVLRELVEAIGVPWAFGDRFDAALARAREALGEN